MDLTPAFSTCSSRLYARLAPSQTRFFRYLLEGYDNLAYTSVVDRKGCILKIVFTAGQRAELFQALEEMRQSLEFELLDLAGVFPEPPCEPDPSR